MILLMACARMDEDVLPEQIRRSFGNNYKQNKNKYRILLKGQRLCTGQLYLSPVQTLGYGLVS